jgi:hypothetical protein
VSIVRYGVSLSEQWNLDLGRGMRLMPEITVLPVGSYRFYHRIWLVQVV